MLIVDLAFDASGADLCEVSSPGLGAEQIWIRHLKLWIEAIRSNGNLTCPVAVREADAMSLGLTFSDGSTERMNIPAEIWRRR